MEFIVIDADAHHLDGSAYKNYLPERYRARHGQHLARYFANPHLRAMGAGLEYSKGGGPVTIEEARRYGRRGRPISFATVRREAGVRRRVASGHHPG